MISLTFAAIFEAVIGIVAAIVSVVVVLLACFVSPVLVLIVFCDARTVFHWISRRTNQYVAWLFFAGCVARLLYWYFRLTPLIAQVFIHESGV